MNIKDIRLTLDELDDAVHNPPTSIFNEFLSLEEEARHIANTATDKAIKVILNHMNSRDVGGVNPEWAISNTFHQALKKLIGG